MSKYQDLIGQRYGRLLVTEFAGRSNSGKVMWKCKCDCGNTTIVRACCLKSGNSTSCGCLQKERIRSASTTHGGYGSRLHKIWEGIKSRCGCSSDHSYKRYGGRGITVCDEWLHSFEAFRDWALANGYRDDLTIDRIDNDGPYCPENCHWATMKQQNNNQSRNRVITHNGESRTLAQWAELTGINPETLRNRLNKGWSTDRALTKKGVIA